MTELDNFHQEKDRFLKESADSPLSREQKHQFKALAYFPENDQLRFVVRPERH